MKIQELEAVQQKLLEFVDEFGTLLGRCDRHKLCRLYLSGLLLDGDRKSIQPIAEKLPEGNEQNLQQFVNQSTWKHEPIQAHLIEFMLDKLQSESGVLVLDDTALPKKGKHSVGVARQYCGALGQISNCQAIVSWHFATKEHHFPLHAQIYLPKEWTDDPKRMKKVGVPSGNFEFKEKWRIALDLLDQFKDAVPHKCIVADAGYGVCRKFLSELDRRNENFVVQIRGYEKFWPSGLKINETRHIKYDHPLDPKVHPLSAEQWAKNLCNKNRMWKKVTLHLQEKRTVKATAIRVREIAGRSAHFGMGAERWLVIEKFQDGTIKYWLSNLSKDVSVSKIIYLAHQRWQVEQGYQQLKEELGLDHFEGRSWIGLNHHITLCFMAFDFLALLRQDFIKKKIQKKKELQSDVSVSYLSSSSQKVA